MSKTKTDLAKVAILKHPEKSITQIAAIVKCSARIVDRAKAALREEGTVIPVSEKQKIDVEKRKASKVEREKKKEETKQKEFDLKHEIKQRRESARVKALEANLKKVMDDYAVLAEAYDNALLIGEPSQFEIPKIDLNHKLVSQATAICQWSDFHVEERIDKNTTRGLNEFNPTIAAKRVDKLVENTLKIIKKERQDSKIENIFICLGGDFINNFLHEHDVQMNFMHPVEATIYAKTLLAKALTTIARNGSFKKITVMCIRGNHARLTKRMQSSNDYLLSWESILYYMLKQELNDSVFEWHIPESEFGYIEIYGKKIRCFHGHQIQFQGGVGDLTIPLNKFIMKQDKTESASWNLLHHWHRLWQPTANSSLNGSLCGFNSYALSKGFQYEPPLQAFQLLDAKRGFTVRIPVFCE